MRPLPAVHRVAVEGTLVVCGVERCTTDELQEAVLVDAVEERLERGPTVLEPDDDALAGLAAMSKRD